MKNFKNYLYGNSDAKIYGKVYHDKKNKQAMLSDGRFMVVSKELYDESKDVVSLKKGKSKDFDYSQFKYMSCVLPQSNREEEDFQKFKECVVSAEELLFDEKIPYEDALYDKVFFKDFDLCLSVPIIHAINQFIDDNKGLEMKVFFDKNDCCRNALIEAYDPNPLSQENEWLNLIAFAPIKNGFEYQAVVEGGKVREEIGVYEKNIETRYSWSDMANEFTNRGIPHEVVSRMADVETAMILNRPVMSMFKFDEWLHEKYGDYESEGRSMHDLFNEMFKDDADKMAWYFGIESEEKK